MCRSPFVLLSNGSHWGFAVTLFAGDTRTVWFKLKHSDGAFGALSELKCPADTSVATLRDLIYEKNKIRLSHCDAADLVLSSTGVPLNEKSKVGDLPDADVVAEYPPAVAS